MVATTRLGPGGYPVANVASATPSAATTFGWYAPFEPPLGVRSRADEQPTNGWLRTPATAPQGWFQPFSEPAAAKTRSDEQPAGWLRQPATAPQGWYAAFDQPRPRLVAQAPSDFFVDEPASVVASISGMAWYQPFDVPKRMAVLFDANPIWVPLPATPVVVVPPDIDLTLTKEQLEAWRREQKRKARRRRDEYAGRAESEKSLRESIEGFFREAEPEEAIELAAALPVIAEPANIGHYRPLPAPFIERIDWRTLEVSQETQRGIEASVKAYAAYVERERAEKARRDWEAADEDDVEFLLFSM